MKPWDVAIVGGGILGASIAYWLSAVYEGCIAVYEQEADVAMHASGRNTGVVHRPFYLHPERSRLSARSAVLSYDMWRKYAQERRLPWKVIGTLKVALGDGDLDWLDTYLEWAKINGLTEDEVELLDSRQARALEPNVVCEAALHAKKEAAVDFRAFTRELKKDAEANGVNFVMGRRVLSLEPWEEGIRLETKTTKELEITRHVINCAGGDAVDLAHSLGVALEYTDLHFRGEYWKVALEFASLARRNIYTVPRHPSFPFLDPHWIVRANGGVEIGPNAVPVSGPWTYEGFFEGLPSLMRKVFEIPLRNKVRLSVNPTFLGLAAREALGSLSKAIVVDRVRRFLPQLEERSLIERGAAGIRSSVIGPDGNFVRELIEIEGPNSVHFLNYNSPGATGALAFAAFAVERLASKGQLDGLRLRAAERGMRKHQEIIEGFS